MFEPYIHKYYPYSHMEKIKNTEPLDSIWVLYPHRNPLSFFKVLNIGGPAGLILLGTTHGKKV